jgi:nucleotide-binding universal stress UspA family protein
MTHGAPFRRVLHPTDFSDCARAATDSARELARSERAKLLVIHAWQPALYPGTDSMIVHTPDAPPMRLLAYLRLNAERQLERLVKELREAAPGVEIEGALVDGAPDDEIVRLAEAGDAVVLGTHGRGPVAHLLLGSVAERVVRRSVAPVLTVRAGGAHELPAQRILVPIDFSAPSRAAVELAARLAGRGASVDVLHVWETPHHVGAAGEAGGDALVVHLPSGERSTVSDYIHDSAKREMHAFLAGLSDLGHVELRRELRAGAPADAIVEAAQGYDLVVMGTHGRRGLPHVFLGSVAEKVVRRAPCPVWTLRG